MYSALLIDDNDVNRDLISRRLVRSGWLVFQAEGGLQGVETASSRLPDLILMDIALPDIDGLEAIRVLKQQGATSRIPIIALTAHAMASDHVKALEAGSDEYETKPVDFNRLLTKMEALVRQYRAAPSPNSRQGLLE